MQFHTNPMLTLCSPAVAGMTRQGELFDPNDRVFHMCYTDNDPATPYTYRGFAVICDTPPGSVAVIGCPHDFVPANVSGVEQ